MMTRTISDMNSVMNNIASAVQEQDDATSEMAAKIAQVANGTKEVTSSMADVNQTADISDESAGDVLKANEALAAQIETLQVAVNEFVQEIRAA